MNINKKILSVLIISSLQVNHAAAYLEFSRYVGGSTNFYVSGPADRLQYASIIINTGSSTSTICNSKDLDYTLGKVDYEPLAVWTGKQFQSTPNHPLVYLYESGVSGLSLSPQGGYYWDGPGNNFQSMPPVPKTYWTGSMDNATRLQYGYLHNSGMYVYKDENRLVGNQVIPTQPLFRYLCKDTSGTIQEVYNYSLSPIYISGKVTGCTPDNSTSVLDMDKVAIGDIQNADPSTLIGTKQVTFSLKCDPNIDVLVSFVDLSDVTNVSDTSTLSADSTAKGVGFAITGTSGNRLRFGPDGSATNIPGQIKYYIQNSGNASESNMNPISTRLGFSYVRKAGEEVKAGTAKSVIGLTYSYQ